MGRFHFVIAIRTEMITRLSYAPKTPVMIAMSNPPLYFFFLFADWIWRKHGHTCTVFMLPGWHLMPSSRYQRSNSFAQWTFCWSMVRKRRTCAMAPSVTWPTVPPLDFFVWGCMKSRVYLNGKPDTREQLMQRKIKLLLASEMNWSAYNGCSHWRAVL
jgi:hypothetical protein